MDPIEQELLSYFAFKHLPPELQVVARPFSDLALRLYAELPDDRPFAKTTALRKLLESKDAAVRAALKPSGTVTLEYRYVSDDDDAAIATPVQESKP